MKSTSQIIGCQKRSQRDLLHCDWRRLYIDVHFFPTKDLGHFSKARFISPLVRDNTKIQFWWFNPQTTMWGPCRPHNFLREFCVVFNDTHLGFLGSVWTPEEVKVWVFLPGSMRVNCKKVYTLTEGAIIFAALFLYFEHRVSVIIQYISQILSCT